MKAINDKRNRLRWAFLATAAAALLAAWGPTSAAAQRQPSAGSEVRVLPVKGNIWLISAGGTNVVASIGKDGVMLVDSGPASLSTAVMAAIQALDRQVTSARMPQRSCVGVVEGCAWWSSSTFLPTTAAPPAPKPIVGIINTSFDADHVGGNAAIAASGRSHVGLAAQDAWIIAHEKAPTHQDKSSALPSSALPSETYDGASFKLNYFNGEGVVLWHLPAAHTDGDTVVQFRLSEVLAVGDLFDMTAYPVIDVDKGGTIQGTVDALNWLLDMAVVEHMMEGGTMVIPGHGRLADSADVSYYRDMVTIVRDRVRAAVQKGMTLPQVKAAKLTRDYDPRFNRNPAYTADMFVEAVFRSLAKS
jgi:cyclase